MLVQNSRYPEFVADQLLTSDNLNDLFGYLDEQGRITRTNLIGIGIVCGLEVKTSADGTSITITKGTGVTSEGYMVTIPETTYTDYVDYDTLKEEYYEKFVNIAGKTEKFTDVYELKQAAVESSIKLSHNFLNGGGATGDKKVVMLFIEKLKIGNKNCNPNSCDDKGITVEINIRPLLVRKADVDTYTLKSGTDNYSLNQSYIALDEIRIRRFDVPNTRVATTADVFNAYKDILNTTFLNKTEQLLTGAWNVFYQAIGSEYNNVNPFSGLANAFSFLHNGTIDSSKVIFMQYYYDHFSDLVAAYDEFRIAGMEILSTCCPDSSLFPRHLLLDLAIKDTSINYSQYRHYFIYSPLFQQKDLMGKLKMLFRRMVLMRTNFSVPVISGANSLPDPYLRITPSRLDASHISYKAIPYYYMVNNGANPLFKNWSYEKSFINAANKNLSYHAALYSSIDFVSTPLLFDLEPYNFLRIEGIIGKQYNHVLRNIKRQIQEHRLPTDVIAICTDNNEYTASNASHNSRSLSRLSAMTREGIGDIQCFFKDIETVYDTIKNESLCSLCKELRYYYEIPIALTSFNRSKPTADNNAVNIEEAFPSEVELFERCTKVPYMVKPNTFGVIIERIYKQVGLHGEVTIAEILEALGVDINEDRDGDGKPDIQIDASLITAFMLMMPILEIPIYIIRLGNYFTEDLHDFDVRGYCRLQELITQKIKGYKSGASLVTNTQREEIKTEMVRKESDAVKLAKANEEAKMKLENFDNENAAAAAPPPPAEPAGTAGVNNNRTTSSLQINSLASMQNGLAFLLLYMLILEDLYDHFDVLIYNCKCRALMGLKEEYLRRVTELTELRQLQNFSRRHPGLQHKAGVTMGGTFIIVYHVPPQIRKAAAPATPTKGGNIIRGLDRISVEKSFEPGKEKEIVEKDIEKSVSKIIAALKKKKVTVAQFIEMCEKVDLDPRQVYAYIRRMEPKVLDNITDLDDVDVEEPTHTEDAIEDASNDLQEGIVIADFYVPYLCYSNCPPVVYQVEPIKDVPVSVNFSLQTNPKTNTNVYSVEDDTPYLFTVSPQGGVINNGTESNGVFKDGDNFVFYPVKVEDLLGNAEKIELTFTYAHSGVTSTPVKVTVYNLPQAKIIVDPDKMPQAVGTTFKISGETKYADKFLWLVNGKESSTEQHLGEHTITEAGKYTLSLSVVQSATGASAQAEDVTIEIMDQPSVNITSKPVLTSAISVGSTVTFEAQVNNADRYMWLRNNEKIANTKELSDQVFDQPGSYTYKLIVSQSTTGQEMTSNAITVQVEALPTASIMTQPSAIPQAIPTGTTITFNGISQNAQQYQWTIETAAGQTQATTQNLGAIPFLSPGVYTIKFRAIQTATGKFADAAPVVINVQPAPTASIITIPTLPPKIPAGTTITFNGNVQNAQQYQWSVTNAAGGVVKNGNELNLGAVPFTTPGVFKVTLMATQTPTGAVANATPVMVNVEQINMYANIMLDPPSTETYQTAGARVNFLSETNNVNTYQWHENDFPIPGATLPVLRNYPLNTAGTYNFTLTGEHTASEQPITSNTISIIVTNPQIPGGNPTEKNTCGELADVTVGFAGLKTIDKKNFPQFQDAVLVKLGITSYFEQLIEIVSAPLDVQLDFFEENISSGGRIDENLKRWMQELAELFVNDDQKAFHLLIAALYRLLYNLAMYISCIQKGDIGKAVVPLLPLWEDIYRHLQAIIKILPRRTQKAIDQFNAISTDTNNELGRMETNGGTSSKPTYKEALEAILNLFS